MNPQYIITEEENHPDRLIYRTIGPFTDDEVAHALAKALEDSPQNLTDHGTRRFWYYVTELTTPEAVRVTGKVIPGTS